MQEEMDSAEEAKDVVGMIHLPGKNDAEWEEFKRRLKTRNSELSNLTITQRTASEEARMRDLMAQADDAEEEGPDDHPDWA